MVGYIVNVNLENDMKTLKQKLDSLKAKRKAKEVIQNKTNIQTHAYGTIYLPRK